jgi:hypothetical protein
VQTREIKQVFQYKRAKDEAEFKIRSLDHLDFTAKATSNSPIASFKIFISTQRFVIIHIVSIVFWFVSLDMFIPCLYVGHEYPVRL